MPDQSADTVRRIVLASRPEGAPVADNFRLEIGPMATPGPGEILVEVAYLSLDPYMRGRMNAGPSYAAALEVGDTMVGEGVGTVLASNAPGIRPGDTLRGQTGWASHAVLPADQCRKVDPAHGPVTTSLGVLGMPGMTAWHGLTAIGKPKAGETVVVAAATGPVGSMVGQLAKARGLRAVGIAGGAEKCALATDLFGFDACIDHRAHADPRALRTALARACPDGVDIYYENVGGPVLQAVLPLMNPFGRIPLCGMVAWYNGVRPDDLPLAAAWRTILTKFLTVEGFIIFNHWDEMPDFLAEVAPKVASGAIRYLEDMADGLEAAPEAFIAMLTGGNTGKQLVRIK